MGLIFLSGFSFLQGFGTEVKRYYVYSDSKPLREKLGVVQEFGHAFSAELTKDKLRNLQIEKVNFEPVTIFSLEELEESAASKTISDIPLDQTPWGIERIYNDTTLSQTDGGIGIKVAVLDTGASKNHPDLKNRINECKDFTTISVRNTCFDGHGHGTHVSGIILADAGKDKTGIYGIAPDSRLNAYKVCNDSGFCFGDSVAKAIMTAADNGANIVSMSFAGPSLSSVEREAIDYAYSKGLLLVAAAGNTGPDLNSVRYPAAYSKVMAVAALDANNSVSDFSSRGINDGDYIIEESEIEVAAPGEGIESTWKNGGYSVLSGTSMATPHISGLAAKFWSSRSTDLNLDGVVSASEVRQTIQSRALTTDIFLGYHAGLGDDPASGFGLPTVPIHHS